MSCLLKLSFVVIDTERQSQSPAPSWSRFSHRQVLDCLKGYISSAILVILMCLYQTTLLIPRTLLSLLQGLKWLLGLVPFPDHSWQKLGKEFHFTHINCLFKVDYCMSAFSSKIVSKQLCLMARAKKRGSIFQQQKVSDFFHSTFHCKAFRRKQNPRSGYSGFRSITGYAFPHKNGLVRTRTNLFFPSLADLARWILGIVIYLFCCSPTNGDGLFLTSAQRLAIPIMEQTQELHTK